MKKLVMIPMACMLVAICLLGGCSGKKYSDVEKASNQYAEIIEEYTTSLDKAKDAKDVAKAINNFADGMKKLQPTMKKLAEKYPELKNNQNPPEEFKKIQSRMEAAAKKMTGAMMKAMPYMNDPDVRKAQERMGQASASWGQ